MISPRWRKVMRDLWLNKTRTALVVFSIAVGTFAVGVIINSQLVLSSSLDEMYEATNPAHANITTANPFDPDITDSIRNIEGVADAEARRSVIVRLKTGPDQWVNLQLVAVPDFEDIQLSKITPVEGTWPPPEDEILIERSALGMVNAEVGDVVTIKGENGQEHQIRIAGTSHDLQASIYVLGGIGYGHMNIDLLRTFGSEPLYNEMHIRAAGDPADSLYLKGVIDEVQDKLERGGSSVLFTFIQPPGQLPTNYIVQAILAVLGSVGVLSLLLSGFLVVNTISAVLTQQIKQIGVMKTFGAKTGMLVPMYLLMVMLFGLLALVVALPLSLISSYYLTLLVGGSLNFDLSQFQVSPAAIVVQVVVALVVPLVAGLFPILNGTRVTVYQAINDQGVSSNYGNNIIDRFLTGATGQRLMRWFSRPSIISLRNTFRRKRRLILTLFTLIIGGTIFMSVATLQSSLRSTLDSWLAYFQYDVAVQFARPYRVEQIQQALDDVDGVVEVEGFGYYTTRRVRPDGTNSGNIIVYAPPVESTMIKPALVEGRWMRPGETNTVVLNTFALQAEPDEIKPGDTIELKIDGRASEWVLVGIVNGGSPAPSAFISYEVLSRRLGEVGQAPFVMVKTEGHSVEEQTRMSTVIENALTDQGFRVGVVAPAALDKQTIEGVFVIIFGLLSVVAVILALVGGLGLMGTMSINVLERTREVGVMRAIGASTRAILRIIIFEGMLVGAISWLIGLLLAIPIGRTLSDTVGEQLLNSALDYEFSSSGMGLWLFLVVVLAAIASFLPARRAARLTVREVLSYE